jgi:hypothetical protein
MHKLVVKIDLPRKKVTKTQHPAYIVLNGETIEELAEQMLDIKSEHPELEIITGVPQSLLR